MHSGDGREILTIGVLSLQGGVAEHMVMLSKIDSPSVRVIAVRQLSDLAALDGIILPGGESTALMRLLVASGMTVPLQERVQKGMPVWGTCAGLILMAQELVPSSFQRIPCIDITVIRNAYGSQLESFVEPLQITGIPGSALQGVFIRAPEIIRTGEHVEVLATCRGKAVVCRQGNRIVTAFHPELTDDDRFHHYFVDVVQQYVYAHRSVCRVERVYDQ